MKGTHIVIIKRTIKYPSIIIFILNLQSIRHILKKNLGTLFFKNCLSSSILDSSIVPSIYSQRTGLNEKINDTIVKLRYKLHKTLFRSAFLC